MKKSKSIHMTFDNLLPINCIWIYELEAFIHRTYSTYIGIMVVIEIDDFDTLEPEDLK